MRNRNIRVNEGEAVREWKGGKWERGMWNVEEKGRQKDNEENVEQEGWNVMWF